jgi:hypothetical protein
MNVLERQPLHSARKEHEEQMPVLVEGSLSRLRNSEAQISVHISLRLCLLTLPEVSEAKLQGLTFPSGSMKR